MIASRINRQSLRIAQVAPLYESVPPKCYGGTERIVSYIAEELVRQGHDVTLFASGDSITKARLVSPCERALRLNPDSQDVIAPHVLLLEQVMRESENFDLIHFHCDYLHFPLSRRHNYAHVTTLHGRLDLPELEPLYREFDDMPLVSISDSQRTPLPWCNWQSTIYHGLPQGLYTYQSNPGQYLAFLGRLSPEKGAERAIEIAKQAGMPLKIAAKIPEDNTDYYQNFLKPLIEAEDHKVTFVGEIGGKEKDEFLGKAYALLFPIDWPEPFGLVMIEAMACGTPVIAYRRGSVPEVMEDSVTGFIVDDEAEAIDAVHRVGELSRLKCRQVFDHRFTATRMVEDYVQVYRRLLANSSPQPRASIKTPLSSPTHSDDQLVADAI